MSREGRSIVRNNHFSKSPSGAMPLVVLSPTDFAPWRRTLTGKQQAWIKSVKFDASAGTYCMIPDDRGKPAMVAAGGAPTSIRDWSAVAETIPAGHYLLRIGHARKEPEPETATQAALGWALAGYTFNRYRKNTGTAPPVRLVWPRHADQKYVLACASAIRLVRDLINTPANDMGPADLAAAARKVAKDHKARFRVVVGDRLPGNNFPAIHAVGRASSVAPRLIDFTWGHARNPGVTLVGKGVCFDSGGLDIKSAAAMKIMKKDMGGAAQVLGLASMIMALKVPVRLRVLIPAVENSIAGNAMRPGDVIPTRKGLTVEIGNTDAEGRVILADALTLASADNPDMIVDFATLTGAARVALGTEIPALFCNDDRMAAALLESGERVDDPLWRMPLWAGYRQQVTGKVADLNNAPEGGFGGAITAALFLEHFVQRDKSGAVSWAHIDLMAWNPATRPGRPEGGEAMGIRAVFDYIMHTYGSS